MTQTKPVPKNAAPALDENAELGFGALLVAEAEDGSYEPVSVVSTIKEARFMAGENFRSRMIAVENADSPMCPDVYKVWIHGMHGYRVISEIEVA